MKALIIISALLLAACGSSRIDCQLGAFPPAPEGLLNPPGNLSEIKPN